jgi:hypothetical protein
LLELIHFSPVVNPTELVDVFPPSTKWATIPDYLGDRSRIVEEEEILNPISHLELRWKGLMRI